ncbi:MAG TPA: cyclic nucleotide-binding domain-containing protein [Candidatus Limnocylindrales bacterium]
MTVDPTLDRALASGWFGASLPDAARRRLASLAVMTSVPLGATVIREGAAVDALGVVVEGRLAIRLAVPGRDVVTVLTIEPGDLVGWSALVPPYRATSTIVALEPTTIVTFPGERLRPAMDVEPALAVVVLRGVLEAVARRLAATRTQLLDLFARSETEPW